MLTPYIRKRTLALLRGRLACGLREVNCWSINPVLLNWSTNIGDKSHKVNRNFLLNRKLIYAFVCYPSCFLPFILQAVRQAYAFAQLSPIYQASGRIGVGGGLGQKTPSGNLIPHTDRPGAGFAEGLQFLRRAGMHVRRQMRIFAP